MKIKSIMLSQLCGSQDDQDKSFGQDSYIGNTGKNSVPVY